MTKKLSFGFSPREVVFYNNRLHRLADHVLDVASAIGGDDPPAAAIALSRVYESGDVLREIRDVLLNEVFPNLGELVNGEGKSDQSEPEQTDTPDDQ